jgi:NAD dependent epimerase/dehydratase family enzyme
MRTVAKEIKRPFIIPRIPSILLKLIMGESAGMILEGSRISPQKAIDLGFIFQFLMAKEAIQEALA